MTITILFAVLAAAVLCAYIPWGERVVRGTSLSLALVASGMLGYLAYGAVTHPAISGYAAVWNIDGAAALTLAVLSLTYIAASVIAYAEFGQEHIHGSMTLSRLRHAMAQLSLVAAAVTAVAAGNSVWFLPLAVCVLSGVWYMQARSLATAFSGGLASLLAVAGTVLVVQGGTAWNPALWAGQMFTGFGASNDLNVQMLTLGAVLILASIGVVIGAFPFALGAIASRRTVPAPFGILFNTAVVSALIMAALRYQSLVLAVRGDEGWAETLFLVGGLVTMAYAVVHAWKARDTSDVAESIRAWIIGAILFVLAVGAAGVIAAVLFLAALAPTMVALAAARGSKITNITWYLSTALPGSALFIPLVILIGYGLQLQLMLTVLFVTLYVAMALLIARFVSKHKNDEHEHKRSAVTWVSMGAIMLQITLGIFFTMPNAIVLAIKVVQTVAGPSF